MNSILWTWLALLSFLVLPLFATDDRPPPSYILAPDMTFRAPDGSFSIRQYCQTKDTDDWQQWVKPRGRSAYRLTEANPNDTGFMDPAEWHLAPDGHWLVRTQRTGSGTSEMLIYNHDGKGNVIPIPEFQAYEFYSRYSGLAKDQWAIDHCWFDFVRWSGPHQLILRLSGQSTMCEPMWVTDDWGMGYNFEKRTFFLTEDLISQNERRLYPVVRPVETTSDRLH